MNIYQTETEQVEVIKKWFKQYGHWVSSCILVILLVIGGYRLWERHTLKINSQASERYQQLMLAVADNDKTLISAQSNDLMLHYPNTIYAQGAALTQAKLFVSEEKWNDALDQLNVAITHGKSPALRQIARLRSARILCTFRKPEDYQKALIILETIDDIAYLPAIDEMKGDVYLALNDKKQARVYYLKALKAFLKAGSSSPFLEMKLNEITE